MIAGGRYDGLIESIGGPPTPAVGWAAGIERLGMMIEAPRREELVVVIPDNDQVLGAAEDALQKLRANGIPADMAFRGKVKRRVSSAQNRGARALLYVRNADAAGGQFYVRYLGSDIEGVHHYHDMVRSAGVEAFGGTGDQ